MSAGHEKALKLLCFKASVRETGLELREIGKRQVKPSYMAQFYNRKRQQQSIMHNREKRRAFLVVVSPYTNCDDHALCLRHKNAERRSSL